MLRNTTDRSNPNSQPAHQPTLFSTLLIDGAGWYDPLVGLTGDGADVFEVDVVVEHRKMQRFRCSGNQQVRKFASALAARGQQSLHM